MSQHTEYPCGPAVAGAAITKPSYREGWAEACQQCGGASSSVAGNGDSYSNRKGKGTHAAVRRVQAFARQVHSGQGGGWYLQLDIHNFFNSMHRATLYGLLKRRLMTASATAFTPSCGTGGLPAGLGGNGGALSTDDFAEGVSGGSNPPMPAHRPPALQEGRIHRYAQTPESAVMLRAVHALLRRPATHTGIHYRVSRAERDAVPPHKRLANAAPGCGLPIGNLSSQFFANVYLNELDQFVKHTLKAKRYARYVDDFVLIHHDRAQLAAWLPQIEQFLQDRLRLTLKADIRLQPLTAGLDFLGYWIYPTHTLVRPRVIHHAREKLDVWQQRHVRRTANGWRINADPQQQDRLRSVWASYQGHFRHADSLRLQQAFYRRYGWLMQLAPTVFPETLTSSTARNSP